jgi:3-oxoacyl-[acyl-carrier protein] reductase
MRVALVTGGTRGIGLSIARRLAGCGFDLALCGRRPEQEVVRELDNLRRTGAKTMYLSADVSDRSARRRLVEAVRSEYGRLDVLVNNAGIAPRQRVDLLRATEESYEEVMRVNLEGPHFLTQACAVWMVEERMTDQTWSGCIVNISSMSASVVSTNRGEYCMSKAALSMSTKLWATRLGEFDIPVYEVRPGIIRTEMTAAVSETYSELLKGGLAIQKRWGTPDDVASVVAALVRGEIPYSTGQVICVDGGLTVQRL